MDNICLYFHINPIKLQIFYVGIGHIERAYSKKSRSKFWHSIVNKYGIVIDIIHENLKWEDACMLEIKYIKHFGRRDLNAGPLVNLTDGGDGTLNHIISEEQRKRVSEFHSGRKRPGLTRIRMSETLKSSNKHKTHNMSMKGIERSEDIKKNIKESLKFRHKIVQCPHCNKEGIEFGMKRWHFDNCKYK